MLLLICNCLIVAAHHAAAGNVDGPFLHTVNPGKALSAAVAKTGIFPGIFTSIIMVGEESGALDSILEKTSEFYEEESDAAIGQLVGMIEPVMIILMGVVIGLVLAGVFPLLYSGLGDVQ